MFLEARGWWNAEEEESYKAEVKKEIIKGSVSFDQTDYDFAIHNIILRRFDDAVELINHSNLKDEQKTKLEQIIGNFFALNERNSEEIGG